MSVTIGSLFKRYCVVILLPTIVASSIYADYSHTKQWKNKISPETK